MFDMRKAFEELPTSRRSFSSHGSAVRLAKRLQRQHLEGEHLFLFTASMLPSFYLCTKYVGSYNVLVYLVCRLNFVLLLPWSLFLFHRLSFWECSLYHLSILRLFSSGLFPWYFH